MCSSNIQLNPGFSPIWFRETHFSSRRCLIFRLFFVAGFLNFWIFNPWFCLHNQTRERREENYGKVRICCFSGELSHGRSRKGLNSNFLGGEGFFFVFFLPALLFLGIYPLSVCNKNTIFKHTRLTATCEPPKTSIRMDRIWNGWRTAVPFHAHPNSTMSQRYDSSSWDRTLTAPWGGASRECPLSVCNDHSALCPQACCIIFI